MGPLRQSRDPLFVGGGGGGVRNIVSGNRGDTQEKQREEDRQQLVRGLRPLGTLLGLCEADGCPDSGEREQAGELPHCHVTGKNDNTSGRWRAPGNT